MDKLISYLKPAAIAVLAVIVFNAICSYSATVKSAVNSIPGNANTWG